MRVKRIRCGLRFVFSAGEDDRDFMPKEQTESWKRWSPFWRVTASVLIGLHILAVFAAPWSSPPPSPLLAQEVTQVMMPYQVSAFLNHGYRFFAPDPGPSHIIRYEMTMADGSVKHGRMPDPQEQWPRLLYHRHFMMTEMMYNNQAQINDNPPLDLMTEEEKSRLAARNERARNLVRLMSDGIATQLLKKHQGERVHLFLQRHEIPFPEAVQEGMQLDDPSLYVDLVDLGEFTGDRS